MRSRDDMVVRLVFDRHAGDANHLAWVR
jgi:hypothetical protein